MFPHIMRYILSDQRNLDRSQMSVFFFCEMGLVLRNFIGLISEHADLKKSNCPTDGVVQSLLEILSAVFITELHSCRESYVIGDICRQKENQYLSIEALLKWAWLQFHLFASQHEIAKPASNHALSAISLDEQQQQFRHLSPAFRWQAWNLAGLIKNCHSTPHIYHHEDESIHLAARQWSNNHCTERNLDLLFNHRWRVIFCRSSR